MKKIISLLLVLSVCIAFCVPMVSATQDKEEVTIGEIEKAFLLYMDENHPEISYGSAEYISFLTDQLMFGCEASLAAQDYYDLFDLYAGEYLYQCEISGCAANDVFELSDSARKLTPTQILAHNTEKRNQEAALTELAAQNQITAYSSYSVSNAIKYAKEWAKGRNMAYYSFAKDCTNFVSQALVAGGYAMNSRPASSSGGQVITTSQWYNYVEYDLYTTLFWVSTSFNNVDNFYAYLVLNRPVSVYDNLDFNGLVGQIKIGDVVQLCNSAGTWYHTIIITGYKDGVFTYCGHTNDRLDYSVETLRTGNSSYRVIRPQ